MSLQSLHHINFIFRDLDAAVRRYEQLGLGPFEFDELTARAVRTARVRLGSVWLVLVSPTNSDSVPGRYLAQHGEGFFLLSFGVDDLAQAIDRLAGGEARFRVGEPRSGLMNWRVADIDCVDTLGIQLQLTEERH